MKPITVIVPLHVYMEDLLKEALSSLITAFKEDTVIVTFVGPKGICENAQNLFKTLTTKEYSINIVENDNLDFATQINKAVFDCSTQYFTILEFDDTFRPYYNTVMQEFIEKNQVTSVILPITELYDEKDEFVGFCNEIVWDAAFANINEETEEDNLGVIDSEILEAFMDFHCTGGLFKTEDFITVGGLKTSMKVAMWYEFLLRIANVGKGIYVVPKACYSHLIGRNNSFNDIMHKTITPEEGRFLINYAKEDYINTEDSNKKYEEEKQQE